MISIIICSINPVYLSQVKKNIDFTIGVEYELLVWDNLHISKGICEVYNTLAMRAKFNYVCFLHEDIIFETENWGHKISAIFLSRPDIGVIGVAGSKYKTKFYSGWYTGIKELDCANIIHRYSTGDEHQCLRPMPGSSLEDVICIDGVFICCRKEVWKQVKFDELNLPGFHFYDIDFSMRAATICNVAVTFDILLLHITKGGDYGNNWVKVAIRYHQLPQTKLPVSLINKLPHSVDTEIIKTWLDFLKNYHISYYNRLVWIRNQQLFFKPRLIYSILKFLLYRPLGLISIHKPRKQK